MKLSLLLSRELEGASLSFWSFLIGLVYLNFYRRRDVVRHGEIDCGLGVKVLEFSIRICQVRSAIIMTEIIKLGPTYVFSRP
jgi:hypothetical protein